MSSARLVSALIIALLLPLSAQRANAQTDSARVSLQALQRLEPGQNLRVTWNGKIVTGRLGRLTTDSLYLTSDGAFHDNVVITLPSLERVEKRMRSARQGATGGAVAGAALFGLAALSFISDTDADVGAGNAIVFLGASGIVGGLLGALGGAILGAAVLRWVDIGR